MRPTYEKELFDPDTGQVLLNVADFEVPLNAIRFQGDLVVAELATGSVVRADGTDPSIRTAIATGSRSACAVTLTSAATLPT